MAKDEARVTVWSRLQEAGLAGEVADAIVRSQPVPEKLLRALAGTPVQKRRAPSERSRVRIDVGRDADLTPAEERALEDAACGLSIPQAARKRVLSPHTVGDQRKAVLRKLGAVNMTQAVAIAFESVRSAA